MGEAMFSGYITPETLADLRRDGRDQLALVAAQRVLDTSARVLRDPFLLFQPRRTAKVIEHRRKIMADIAMLCAPRPPPPVPTFTPYLGANSPQEASGLSSTQEKT